MRGETTWHPAPSRDRPHDGARLDRPRRSPSGSTLGVTGSPPVLADRGTDGHGDTAPGVAPRGALWQVQHDAPHGPFHPDR